MISNGLLATVMLLALSHVSAAQQRRVAAPSIESVAARAAIEQFIGPIRPGTRVVIDPMLVHPNEAPGGRAIAQRRANATDQLAAHLAGRSMSRDSVIDCRERPCQLRRADVFVMMSPPQQSGDSAVVTVTTMRQAKRGLQYRTVNVTAVLRQGAWRVARIEELGIS